MLLATATHAASEILETWDKDGLKASIQRDGKVATLNWSTQVDAPLDRLHTLLADPRRAADLISGAKRVVARTATDGSSRVKIERESPFMMPEVWFDVRVSSTKGANESSVTWSRVDGTASVYRRQWILQRAGSRTRVKHSFTVAMPFDLPDVFLRGQLRDQVLGDVGKLRALGHP